MNQAPERSDFSGAYYEEYGVKRYDAGSIIRHFGYL